ncbi:plasmid replication initiator TrfA [Cupriavidus basilensis]|uniref:plasmid replication initiator TrfA n=1 Tax=Cupriavidus basilensis TaxID=68895 RepID=UPI0023E7734A|nr:plasmid replication initiator TrfA [Cupriavidus basilensis]MDF3884772.1 plasmid replication initiator TrfA [Cupriavidus basilensis]
MPLVAAAAERDETMARNIATQDAVEQVNAVRKRALLAQHGYDPEGSMQLKLWADDVRALPNDHARSAIFTTRNKTQKREALQQAPVYHLHNEVKITFTGVELRAEDDELVWLQILDYAKYVPLGSTVEFTLYRLCKDVGWSINGTYYKKAEACLDRLKASNLKFESPRVGKLKAMSFLQNYGMVNKGTRNAKCQVELDQEMIFFFLGSHFTEVVWEKYRSLPPVARRLFDYIGSHRVPYPLPLDKFHSMCGSLCRSAKRWREMAQKACDELKEAKLVQHAWIADGKILCNR